MLQEGGFTMFNVYRYSGTNYKNVFMWPMYNWIQQEPGRGDGSDGKRDNRECKDQCTRLISWRSGVLREIRPLKLSEVL
jgi:hypothetical protein